MGTRQGRGLVRGGALAAALTMVVAGCGLLGDDDGGTASVADPATTVAAPPAGDGQMEMADPGIEEPIEPMGDPSESGSEQVSEGADAVMVAAALDVEEFWRQAYPEVYGEDYEELAGGLWAYGPDTDPADLPPCGGITSYDDVGVNAFYCSDIDLIAWDREGLIEPFIEEFGAFAAAVIMAHEFGHAIQARTGDFTALEQVISELQADCFAGAWVGHVAAGGSETFRAELDELDVSVAGLIEIRDAPGSSPDTSSAHGSGFDRVSAFADGLDEGAGRCGDYGDAPPVVVQEVFDVDEESTMGNLPADELLPLLVTDLEAYYDALFAGVGRQWAPIDDVLVVDPDADEVECGGEVLSPDDLSFASYFCVSENVVVLDGVGLLAALEEIGDFALGAELARQWAFAAQAQADILENTRETFLHADCLTGLYSGDVYFQLRGDEAGLRLSPGDLDEAIISFLAFGGDTSSGTPFERTDAFRTGFLGTLDDCDALLEG